jgi:hypothetical protein
MPRNPSAPHRRAPALRVVEGGHAGIRDYRPSLADLEVELDAVVGLSAAELAGGGPPLGSPALIAALDAVAGLPPCDLTLVPNEPDTMMLEAGADAGEVDRFTALRVYRAMLRAAE